MPPLAVALAGGLCLGAAFDPVAVPYFAPLGVAALVFAVARSTYRQAALRGWVFGLAFFGPLLAWLGDAIGSEAWVLVTTVVSVWFAILGCALVAVRRLPGWPVWAAVMWIAVEVVRSKWSLGGLPWGRLGDAAVGSPWSGLLALLGVTGTGFVVALVGSAVGALLAAGAARRNWQVVSVLVLVATSWFIGWLAPAAVATGTARVAIVQGGVPGDGTELVRFHRQVTDRHADLTGQLAIDRRAAGSPSVDFVLWPENATAVDPTSDEQAAKALTDARSVSGVPIFLGAIADAPDPDEAFSQGLVWDADGAQAQRYTKQHLVPFGEYIPLRSLLAGFSPRLDAITREMQPGSSSEPLDIAGLRVGDALCFDVAYDDVLAPQVRAGAELLTIQTSNAMFLGTNQLDQQFAISRARAIETGRSVVVASVNGQSGAIAPDGSIIARLPQRVSTAKVVTVPLATHQTLAVRLGRGPSYACLMLAALALLAAAATKRRQDSSER
ncbi:MULTISPECIES: apolipoprotein N-acyltransferase [unclassified Nocardioides]|uniref:apolipoprotein N-acyltransferase n=1 Tax=unclassified Nocardioides TaxID=2615069 RepID=UPI0009EFE664|nr:MULTISPECIES: apolipoprotein N-acyltransferase [unclassified Nocardioides]GAW49770.1 Apolipoprotein N-acyltransferase [Nocardioides sp. PD653-B2]GAW56490.1 Apolipoprotein N-acyltransferase [Nocardioides sp. PD653]